MRLLFSEIAKIRQVFQACVPKGRKHIVQSLQEVGSVRVPGSLRRTVGGEGKSQGMQKLPVAIGVNFLT